MKNKIIPKFNHSYSCVIWNTYAGRVRLESVYTQKNILIQSHNSSTHKETLIMCYFLMIVTLPLKPGSPFGFRN